MATASYFRSILHPDHYHGHGKKPPFFEGWYFKMVDASEEHKLAVIPGIFLSDDPARRHAFVQVLDGVSGHVVYHRFPVEQFWAATDAFEIRVGPNTFSRQQMSLQLASPEGSLAGEVAFDGVQPWPVTLLSPGIMGWYAWAPFMECNHGVVSLDHGLSGELVISGRRASFDGGRGYIEKDWGRAFPAGYVWMQSNHFAGERGVCLTASIAIIPWLRSAFPGFIIGLWHHGRLYRFATYTGAKTTHLAITDASVVWTVRDRDYVLEIEGQRAAGGLLLGPTREEMHIRVDETLNASIGVRLRTRAGETLFEGTGRHAGMEVQGDLGRLLALQTKA